MNELFIQFGTGKFLRGFVGYYAHKIQQSSLDKSRNLHLQGVAVQTQGTHRAKLIRDQPAYQILTKGRKNGVVVDEVQEVQPYSNAFSTDEDWSAILETGADSSLKWIVSNSTEAGMSLDLRDSRFQETKAPVSFPAKLACVLRYRFRNKQCPIWIIPTELVDYNADVLKRLVLKQSRIWGWDTDSDWEYWLRERIEWVNTVVDRMVVACSDNPQGLNVQVEPYVSWALSRSKENDSDYGVKSESIEVLKNFDTVRVVDSSLPWSRRKIRLLNAAHTLLVELWISQDRKPMFVREIMEQASVKEQLREILYTEVKPTLDSTLMDIDAYVESTIERFCNPYLDHRLEAIAMGHETKIKTRVLPIIRDYEKLFGSPPTHISRWLKK